MSRRLESDATSQATLALAGLMLLGAALLAARLAVGHMQAGAAVCGSAALAHCIWCVAATGLTLAGLGSLWTAAALPRMSKSRTSARHRDA